MSEQTDGVSSGGYDGPLHFLKPSGPKVGVTLLVFQAILVLLFVTSFLIPVQCGGDFINVCLTPAMFVLAALAYIAGRASGATGLAVFILVGTFFLVCLVVFILAGTYFLVCLSAWLWDKASAWMWLSIPERK